MRKVLSEKVMSDSWVIAVACWCQGPLMRQFLGPSNELPRPLLLSFTNNLLIKTAKNYQSCFHQVQSHNNRWYLALFTFKSGIVDVYEHQITVKEFHSHAFMHDILCEWHIQWHISFLTGVNVIVYNQWYINIVQLILCFIMPAKWKFECLSKMEKKELKGNSI